MRVSIRLAALAFVATTCLAAYNIALRRYITHVEHPEWSNDRYAMEALSLVHPKIDDRMIRDQSDVEKVKQSVDALRPWADTIADERLRHEVQEWFKAYTNQATNALRRYQDADLPPSAWDRDYDKKNAHRLIVLDPRNIPPASIVPPREVKP